MAFGQQVGPPATSAQMRQLQELIAAAGHSDFRDARGPLGLNQRQAGGRFTRDEADALIARLESESGADAPGEPIAGLAGVPTSDLAAELQRRGWVVMEP